MTEDPQLNYLSGYVKLFRSTKKKGWYKKSEYLHVWIHIILEATHKSKEVMFNGENIKLKPGQFITGRKAFARETGISESKVQRILRFFEKNVHQIEQQTCSKNRLITVLNWEKYQNDEVIAHQIEQQVNNNRTTSEQQVNTNNNVNNDNNDNKGEGQISGFTEEQKKLALEIADTFAVRVLNAGPNYRYLLNSIFNIAAAGNFDMLKNQFYAYRKVKTQSGQILHKLENFLGTMSENYTNGEWFKTDWEKKAGEKNDHPTRATFVKPN